MLDLIKELLGIDIKDNSKDTILNFYMVKAKNAIINYLNINEEEYNEMNLDNQTIELSMYYYQNKKMTGIKQYSEGTKHRSYEENGIPESIKTTLPLPKIKLM